MSAAEPAPVSDPVDPVDPVDPQDLVDPVTRTPVATRERAALDTATNRLALGTPDDLAATALRTRSVHAREVLVAAAWPGGGAEQVDAWADRVRSTPDGRPVAVPDEADVYHLGHYARVLVLQTPEPADVARGRALLEALERAGQLGQVHPEAAMLLLHLRCLDGDEPGCARLLGSGEIPEDVVDAVRADLANPFLRRGRVDVTDGGAEAEEEWLTLLTRALHSEALAPWRLGPARDGAAGVLDRLRVDPQPRADRDGEALVTVVVSAYRPGPPLLTAVRSLLAQTWHHLEILVVDDASGPEAEPWLRRAEALDPRVRVIRKAVNGGTYRARNTALRQARGDYLTTLDSDDLLHPQAIATLVRALEETPSRMAVRARGARVSEDAALVRLGYRHRVPAAPTLLVRLDPVLPLVGFFDPARKSADTEYARRIQAVFGEQGVASVDECLLLLRSGETLSSSEFSRGWRHGSRHAYKTLYAPWHEEIRHGAVAYLDPDQDRPVPEPRRWTAGSPRDPALPPPRHLDLVLGGDWRRYGGPQRSMLEEVRAAREAGLRVGIMHLEAMRFATTRDLPLCAPVTDLLRRGEVEWVQVDDDVDIDVLMVRYPPVLQYPPTVPAPCPIRPRHLLVMANQAPVEPDGSDQRYVVPDVTARARELFGTDPVWVPQGAVVRQVLLGQDPRVPLTDWDNPGLIDLGHWQVRDDRPPGAGGAPVVVGRFSRDHVLKHPPTHAEMLAAYDLGEGYTVRMMGSQTTWERLLREAGLDEDTPAPDNWEMVRARSVPPRSFLAGLDFFLYQDHPQRYEAFGRVLLEAAASGVVVIAHPKHRPVFQDLLDYAEPADARAVVESYVRAPQRYAERVAEMRRLVAERYSHASFVERLASLPGMAQRWTAARDRASGRGTRWTGRSVLQVQPTGDRQRPVRVRTADADPGGGAGEDLRVHEVQLRSAADAGRADQLVLVHSAQLSEGSRDRLREALAVAADAQVDAAVEAAVRGSDDIPVALLVRDGQVRVLDGGPASVAGPRTWVAARAAQELVVTG